MKRNVGAVARWIVIGILVVAVAAAAFALIRRRSGPKFERTLVEAIVQSEFIRQVSGTGTVEAALERNLSFKTTGVVDRILVSEGDSVSAGDLLASLDTASLERDLASSRASLSSARADAERLAAQQVIDRLDSETSLLSAQSSVDTANQELADAQKNLDTVERLFDTGAASQNELKAAQDTLASAERRLNQARIALESAQTRLESFDQLASAQRASNEAQISQLETNIANLEEQLNEASLTAPFSGTVTTIGFEVGDQVGVSQTLSLVDTAGLFVRANFDENRAAELKAGQNASITPDANADLELSANVRRVSSVAKRSGNTAQLEVTLDFDNPEDIAQGLVRPGYTVTARITVNDLQDVLLIPLEAITETDGESYVYKVSESEPGQGSVERATVTILDRNATFAAVESAPLKASDLIALINLDALESGTQVSYEPLAE
ncbi:MAG: efflux RND transporter periplasmic adaptor subunit [Trueperaceae bacterium]|nr:efflux RND transporter periplasmic adaptor subunit [Trueperaceae bacterium]